MQLTHAERGGNEAAQIIIWDELGGVMIAGPTPWSEIREFMTREIAWAEERGIAFTAADGLLGLAYAQAAEGDLETARTTASRLREIFAGLPGEVPSQATVRCDLVSTRPSVIDVESVVDTELALLL